MYVYMGIGLGWVVGVGMRGKTGELEEDFAHNS